MQPEVRERPRAPRLQLKGAARHRYRFFEPVVARQQISGHAEDIAVARCDREHLVRFGLELLGLVFDVGQPGKERPGLEARRIDGERLLQQLAGLRTLAGVDGLVGQEHVRGDVGRIDLQHLLRERDRLRRVLVGQRARRPEQGRRPVGLRLERRLERLQRFAGVVGLQEQLAPAGVDRGVARQRRHGLAIRGVGVLELIERAQRARFSRQLRARVAPGRGGRRHDAIEQRVALRPAEHLQEQPQLERGIAARRALGRRPQRRLGLLVASARDQRTRRQRHHGGILPVERRRQRRDVVVAAFEEGARGVLKVGLGAARGLRHPRRDDGEQHEAHGEGKGREAARPAGGPADRRDTLQQARHEAHYI